MVSTFLTYTLDTKSMAKTLARTAAAPATKAEIAYYNANIGKVKTADELIGNYKLYSYAMKAYGLQDFTYAKGFMKKVLTSDLSDSKSFANRLNDSRYKQIAAAFNFSASSATTAQTAATETAMFGTVATKTTDASIGLYQQSFTSEATTAATETDYYSATIGTVKGVDDLLGDSRLRAYILKAYGLDPTEVSNAYLKSMLTSDASDPNSFLSVNGSSADKAMAAQFNFNADGTLKPSTADGDSAYYVANIGAVKSASDLAANSRLFDYVKAAFNVPNSTTGAEFVAATQDPSAAAQYGLTDALAQFTFQNNGGVIAGSSVQTTGQIAATTQAYATTYTSGVQTLGQKSTVMDSYNSTVPSFVTDAAAAADTSYYKAEIGSVTSIAQLTQDSRLFNYVKIAYNLQSVEPQASDDTLKYDLQASFEDPTYAALTGLAPVVAQFDFQSDGTVVGGTTAQSAAQLSDATTAFEANYKTEQTTTVGAAVANYEKRMGSVKTIDQFFASNATADTSTSNDNLPELYQMALRSYGIGETEITKAQMKKILESDPYDPSSYVSKLKDSRFTALAKAFNFDSKGKLGHPVTALSTAQIDSYISSYSSNAKLGLSGTALTKAIADTKKNATYFASTMPAITTVASLLKDKKLTDFILKANNLDPKTATVDELKKAFSADPSKPSSFINTIAGAPFKAIVDAFNFGITGNLVDTKIGTAQNKAALDSTNDLFLHQTLEANEGQTNDGVRLALYFQRKAPNIHSVYDIMADGALYSVVTTTYRLPSAISSMNVDAQAKLLGKFLKVDDLHDPAKLNSFLQRFSVQYDLKNSTSSTASPAISILQGSRKSFGVSAATMLSIAQLKGG